MSASRSSYAFTLLAMIALLLPRAFAARQQAVESADATYAEIDDATARTLVKGCSLPHEVNGPGTSGSQILLQFAVSEKGKLLTVRRVQGGLTHQLSEAFVGCHFKPYKLNGMPTAFHANIVINVR